MSIPYPELELFGSGDVDVGVVGETERRRNAHEHTLENTGNHMFLMCAYIATLPTCRGRRNSDTRTLYYWYIALLYCYVSKYYHGIVPGAETSDDVLVGAYRPVLTLL